MLVRMEVLLVVLRLMCSMKRWLLLHIMVVVVVVAVVVVIVVVVVVVVVVFEYWHRYRSVPHT